MRVLVQIALVAGGSALGGLARWGTGVAFARWLGTALPYGTFFINISGSLFLGWLSTLLAERRLPGNQAWLGSDDLRLALAVGFTGAYTTFSTFEWETHGLLRDGEVWIGLLYSIVSVVLGLIAVRLGVVLVRGI